MANFILLYSGGSTPEGAAEQAAVMEAWTTWFEDLGSALVDAGNPFTPKTKSISSNKSVSDGPVGTLATGYSIVQADSLDKATEKAKGCPVLQSGGKITVYETFKVM